MAITKVAELVRAARKGRSQKQFADMLGIRQSSVSRYESGKASPPVNVIERCMHLVHTEVAVQVPSAEELANQIRVELAGPKFGHVRIALSQLIDAFANERVQTRSSRSASH